jgi:hypothetical protein
MKKFALVVVAAIASMSQAWDLTGHRIVAQIAWDTMKPATRDWVTTLLKDFSPDGATTYTTMSGAASLADDYKHHPKDSPLRVKRTWSNMHFIDYLLGSNPNRELKSSQKEDDTVIYAINEAVNALRDKPSSFAEQGKPWCLAMLIHFVGDIHQPMHCIDDEDSGGNGFTLQYNGSIKNLHALWDDVATEKYKLRRKHPQEAIESAAKDIEGLVSDESVGDLGFGPVGWASESFQIGVDHGYGGAVRDATQTDEYLANWQDIGIKRIATAGYRLRALLESITPQSKS